MDPSRKERMRMHLARHAYRSTGAVSSVSYFRTILSARVLSFSLIVLLFFGGAVNALAERALPGDILYPIKVGVSEEVRAMLTLTPIARAEWQEERIERRLEEAAQLAQLRRLNDEVREMLVLRIGEHARSMDLAIEDADTSDRDEDALTLGSRLQAALDAHETILVRVAVGTEENNADDQAVGTLITAARVGAAPSIAREQDIRVRNKALNEEPYLATTSTTSTLDKSIGSDRNSAIIRTRDSIKKQTKVVRDFLDEKRESLPEETRTTYSDRLDRIKELVLDGDRYQDSNRLELALLRYREASERIHRLVQFVEAEERIALDNDKGGLQLLSATLLIDDVNEEAKLVKDTNTSESALPIIHRRKASSNVAEETQALETYIITNVSSASAIALEEADNKLRVVKSLTLRAALAEDAGDTQTADVFIRESEEKLVEARATLLRSPDEDVGTSINTEKKARDNSMDTATTTKLHTAE